MSQTTIQQVIEDIANQFSQVDLCYGHGTSNPWDEATWAVHHVLDLSFGCDDEAYQKCLNQQEIEAIQALASARIQSRKPMAYLTNKMWFAGIEFYIDERTLVPRSPFAELIMTDFQPWLDISEVSKVLDLCTGSGCIGMAIAKYFPHLEVTASDISEDALEVAKINLDALELKGRVSLHQADLFVGLPAQKFDLIVSNPPYVATCVVEALPEEYQQEPDLGLASGVDGLDHVERILSESVDYLSDNGVLIVEVGLSMSALCEAYPLLPFMWLEFEQGGDGVFLLTAEQLKAHYSK